MLWKTGRERREAEGKRNKTEEGSEIVRDGKEEVGKRSERGREEGRNIFFNYAGGKKGREKKLGSGRKTKWQAKYFI